MLTHRMKSPQTPPEGLEFTKLLMAAAVDIAHEYYLAIVLDRAASVATLPLLAKYSPGDVAGERGGRSSDHGRVQHA